MTQKEMADLRAEYFDGPASDFQGFFDFLKSKGVDPKDFKKFKSGELVRKKRKIARGCGAIMEKRRKKTLYI